MSLRSYLLTAGIESDMLRSLVPWATSVGTYAHLFEAQRKYREAEAIYRDEIKSNPSVPDWWYSLVELFKMQGKDEEARAVREQWLAYVHQQIERTPDDAKPHFDAAVAYCELDDIPNLIAEFNKAARLAKQGRSAIYYSLGRELLVRDALEAAAKAFREALELDPEDRECLYHLAFTHCLSGDHGAEVQVLREVLELDSSTKAKQKRSRFAVSESGSWDVTINIQDILQAYEYGHRAMASALAEAGDVAASIEEYRVGIRRNEYGKSDDDSPYHSPLLGLLMNEDGANSFPSCARRSG